MATTTEEYYKLNSKLLTTTSGTTYQIKALGGKATLIMLGLFEGIDGGIEQKNMMKFITENYDVLLNKIIYPVIIEPKIEADDLKLMDMSEILIEIINISGLGVKDTEEREKFRAEQSSTIP